MNPEIITVKRVTLDDADVKAIKAWFGSKHGELLRQVLQGRIKEKLALMGNGGMKMTKDNSYEGMVKNHLVDAQKYRDCLDVLEEVLVKPDGLVLMSIT